MNFPIRLCVVALFLTNYAHAEVWFQDDFESNTTVNTTAYPTTDPPPAAGDFDPDAPAVGTWAISPEDDPEWAQVSSFTGGTQPFAAHSGNNYLIAGHNGDISSTFDAQGIATANLTSAVSVAVVDFWMWSRVWDTNNQYDVVQARLPGPAPAGGRAWELSFRNRADGLNEIKWNSNGGGSGTVLNAVLTADAWNHVVLEYDGISGFADITINDQPTETQPTLPSFLFPSSFSQLVFRSEHHGYFDDILVSDGAPLPNNGDFDGDGDVDGRDFLVWQRGESPNPLSASDLVDWQANYGPGSLAAAVSAVPEPTSLALVALALMTSACCRKR